MRGVAGVKKGEREGKGRPTYDTLKGGTLTP
jgi:hypothetical protein